MDALDAILIAIQLHLYQIVVFHLSGMTVKLPVSADPAHMFTRIDRDADSWNANSQTPVQPQQMQANYIQAISALKSTKALTAIVAISRICHSVSHHERTSIPERQTAYWQDLETFSQHAQIRRPRLNRQLRHRAPQDPHEATGRTHQRILPRQSEAFTSHARSH